MRRNTYKIDGYTDIQTAFWRAHEHMIPCEYVSSKLIDKLDAKGSIPIVYLEKQLLTELKRVRKKYRREYVLARDEPMARIVIAALLARVRTLDEIIKFLKHKAYKPKKK